MPCFGWEEEVTNRKCIANREIKEPGTIEDIQGI